MTKKNDPKPKQVGGTQPASRLRHVPTMNAAIWLDGYDWLANNGEISQGYLNATIESVERGYTPEEIYYQVVREAGSNRREIAERCRAAANWIISIKDS